MRALLPFVLPLALAACGSRPGAASAPKDAPPPDAGAAAPAAAPARAADAGAVADELAWLPRPRAGGPGAIAVEGFSRIVMGMNDPAYVAGFSADGAWLGYCVALYARTPGKVDCEMFGRDGAKVTLASDVKGEYSAAAQAKLDTWVKEHDIPVSAGGDPEHPGAAPPPLRGTWDFPDITLMVDEHAQGKRGALVRLGGRIAGERPVWVMHVDHAPRGGEIPHHSSWVNALAVSPDGRDLGLVAGFFCMEWCNDFEVRRLPLVRLAAQIYNDTAMTHHAAKEWARSAELLAAAVHADPTFELAAYNLACALARLGDPKAEPALRRAVRLGGPAVAERARRDADFAAVRDSAWFARALGG